MNGFFTPESIVFIVILILMLNDSILNKNPFLDCVDQGLYWWDCGCMLDKNGWETLMCGEWCVSVLYRLTVHSSTRGMLLSCLAIKTLYQTKWYNMGYAFTFIQELEAMWKTCILQHPAKWLGASLMLKATYVSHLCVCIVYSSVARSVWEIECVWDEAQPG